MVVEKAKEGNSDGLYRNASIPTLLAHPNTTRYIMEFPRHTEVGRQVMLLSKYPGIVAGAKDSSGD